MSKKILPILIVLTACLVWSGAAHAKCTLTLKFNNNDAHTITVLGKSQVRVNGGWWSKMNFNDVTIKSGESGTASWTTNMSCSGNAKRDFRIKYEDKSDNATYQNANKTNIDIYDGQTLTWGLKQH